MSFALVVVEFKLASIMIDQLEIRSNSVLTQVLPELFHAQRLFAMGGSFFTFPSSVPSHRSHRLTTWFQPWSQIIEGPHITDIYSMSPTVSNDDGFTYTASRPRPYGSVVRAHTTALLLRKEQRTEVLFDGDEQR